SDVPRAQAVVALEKSIDPGKDVRVTGFVQQYDRDKLECLYGPLHLESREGHSFTKSPVLIVQKVQAVAAAPAASPAPAAPEQRAAAEPQSQTPEALPRTASPLPL